VRCRGPQYRRVLQVDIKEPGILTLPEFVMKAIEDQALTSVRRRSRASNSGAVVRCSARLQLQCAERMVRRTE
jgi:hypothetical protein